MPTTNLPTANHFYTQPIPISAGAEIKLLNRLTSDLDVVFPSGLKFDLSSNSDSLTWINEHNDGTTTDKLIIYVSYPTPVLTKHTFNSVSENVDWELTTQGAPVNLVEGVDYEIEYNDAVSSLFWIELGSPFRNQERGEVAGYKIVPIRIDPISISLTTIGIQTLRGTIRSAVCSSSFGISCGGIEGRLNPVMSVATSVSRPWMQPSYANPHGIYHNSDLYWWLMSTTNDSYFFSLIETIIPNYSFSHNGQSFRSISRVHFPSNLHLDKDISISFSASGENIVKRGSSSLSVAILSVCESNAIKSGSVSLSMSITQVVNGKNNILKAFAVLNCAISTSAEAEKVKMINAFAVLNCAISTSAEAEKGTIFSGESTIVLGITMEASGILNPLNLNWDALTDDDDGMLYSAQESTNTLGTSNGGKLYYSFKTNYKRLMWLDNDELPAGTYQLKIRPFSTRASDGVDIEPYLPLANQLRFAVTNDDGTTPTTASVQRQAYGNPYNVATFNVHSASANLSGSHCQVPVDSSGLVARGAGQDGFSYDHAVSRDGSWQHISESVEHTFNIVVNENSGIYIYITDGSLAFREEQLSFTKIS
jgi:hypothetical protein